MTAVSLKKILNDANKNNYAVAGLVVLAWDDALAFTKAADETGIPWTKVYYRISNNYFWLIILSCVIFLITSANRSIRPNMLPIIGKILVPLYVFGISLLGNSFDAYEGGRLKFMLEPTIFVFIFVQICSALHHFLLGVRTSSKNDS